MAEEHWRAWIAEGVDSGARHAHLAVKIPTQWQPTTTEDAQLVYTADPMRLLAAQRAEYAEQWHATDGPVARTEWPVMQPMPRMEPSHIRATAMEIAERTTQTYDGFHPRHVGMLCDAALIALAYLLPGHRGCGNLADTGAADHDADLAKAPRGFSADRHLCSHRPHLV